MKGYTACYGNITDGGEMLDDGVLLVFRAPHSFTGEDVVEITCHGGIFVVKKALRVILDCGAVPAEPGEFSKRAFLNGKTDLAGAEGIMTLINSQGEQGISAALNILEGALSKKIAAVSDSLTDICAHISAWVDYPDEEIDSLGYDEIETVLKSAAGDNSLTSFAHWEFLSFL